MDMISLVYAQETSGLRDIQPPLEIQGSIILIFILTALLLLLALVGAIGYFFLRTRIAQPKKIYIKSPHELAYERLETLRQQDLFSQGKIKEYYTILSDIVRHYLEDQFQINAPEMTSEEFLWSISNASSLISKHQDLLREFLTSCDLVKFAQYGPTMQEGERSFNLAKALVEATIPVKGATEVQ